MKLGARNQLKGTITSIEKGTVNGIVTIRIAGGEEVVANLSVGSIEELGLKVGQEAYAVFKAMNVIVGIDD